MANYLIRIVPFIFLIAFTLHPFLGFSEASSATKLTVTAPALLPDIPELKEARSLVDMGKLLEARDQYRSLLTQNDLAAEVKRNARKELDQLNIDILFSPIETEDSIIYVVKEGDNLHNIAKKHKVTVTLIKKSNHLTKDIIKPGQKLKISTAKFSIEVDKSDNTLQLFADDMILKTYKVGTGADNSTPVGEFKITEKLENPTWYHDGKAIPPDSPDNILGTRWMGFSLDSYGIHGTTFPETIGTQASSGCIRMYNHEVEELYTIVPSGTQVLVKD